MSDNPLRESSLPEEEVLDVEDIQGNVLPGFNKDHLTLMFFRITDISSTRIWLNELAPYVATTREVLDDRRLRRTITARRGSEPEGMIATWSNLGLSAEALRKLIPREQGFADDAFRIGLKERSGILGDPALGSGEPGDPRLWKVGGPGKEADVVVLVASDAVAPMRREVQWILSSVLNSPRKPRLELIYRQECHDLPGDLKGHEHFGFRDGISLPGVRGRASRDSEDFVTPRLLSPASAEALRFSKPGQALLWPGQFVFGYRKQDPNDPENPLRDPRTSIPREFPNWAKERVFPRHSPSSTGCCRVSRRSTWNYPTTCRDSSAPSRVRDSGKVGGTLAERRSSYKDGKIRPSRLGPRSARKQRLRVPRIISAMATQIRAAPAGFPCCHRRYRSHSLPPRRTYPQMNPRDQGTDVGPASVTLTRIPLRRGLPFGKPYDLSIKSGRDTQRGDRGLMFISYQTSIVDQFEFILSNWANHSDKPNNSPEGHDPILGRPIGGGQAIFEFSDGTPVRCLLDPRWVISTGGGYFFAPSISALKTVLAKEGGN